MRKLLLESLIRPPLTEPAPEPEDQALAELAATLDRAARRRLGRSLSIREAIHDVNLTLALTVVLVVLVIFLFLHRATATMIPAVTMPISLLGAMTLMYWGGYSLDNISLLGITLAVGLVVDDAIVVLENIVRHIEMGKRPLQAALASSSRA